jgi:filamentous hemagglutinin
VAQGEVAIHAVDGLQIDVKQVNQQTVSQAIDAMVKADPQLAWLKDAEQRGDVDWRQVKEIHDSFKYSQSGLGVGAQLALAIAMAVVVGPAAMGALASTGTAVAAGGAAVATAAATTASSSLISNQGDLGAALKDTLSKEAMKGYAISGITAGLTAGLFDGLTATKTNPLTGKVTIDLGSVENIGRFAANQVLQNATSTALSKALGRDASFGDALLTSMLNTVAATSFNAAGDLHLADGSASKIALHALIGGVLAEASGSDFLAGAVAAGANEALATELRRGITQLSPSQRDLLLTSASQLVGLLSAAVVGGDAKAVEAGAWIAKNATQYNFLNHSDMKDFVGDMKACQNDSCYKDTWVAKYGDTTYDQLSEDNLQDALKTVGPVRAHDLIGNIQAGLYQLNELNCVSSACQFYKDELFSRAIQAQSVLEKTYVNGQGIVLSGLNAPVAIIRGAAGELAGAKILGSDAAALSSEATSVNAQAALRAKLSGLQKAQQNAAITKVLPDGRIRYYTQEVYARTEGVTRGASFATEYNPTTGATRQWMESYDQSGNVIRVHPKSINGQPVSAQHYPPTGAELKSWK